LAVSPLLFLLIVVALVIYFAPRLGSRNRR
jgi:hypothetical protein